MEMNEEETLGRVAYEAFLNVRKENAIYVELLETWEDTNAYWKRCWIAAAKAVADRVLEEIVANQASGA